MRRLNLLLLNYPRISYSIVIISLLVLNIFTSSYKLFLTVAFSLILQMSFNPIIVLCDDTFTPYPFDTWSSAYTIDNPEYYTGHIDFSDSDSDSDSDSANETAENPYNVYHLKINTQYVAWLINEFETMKTMEPKDIYDLIPDFTCKQFYLEKTAPDAIKNIEILLELKVHPYLCEVLILLQGNLDIATLLKKVDYTYTDEELLRIYVDNLRNVTLGISEYYNYDFQNRKLL